MLHDGDAMQRFMENEYVVEWASVTCHRLSQLDNENPHLIDDLERHLSWTNIIIDFLGGVHFHHTVISSDIFKLGRPASRVQLV